jgi:predicted ester cyclase
MLGDGSGPVRRFWDDVFNQGKVDAIEDVLSDDFVLHDLVKLQTKTRDDVRGAIERTRAEIPSASAEVQEEFSAEDGRIVTVLMFRAQRPAEAEDEPSETEEDYAEQAEDEAAAEQLSFSGIAFSRVADEKITEAWFLWDATHAAMELKPPSRVKFLWHWPPWDW